MSGYALQGSGGGGGGNFPSGITSGAPADAIVNAAVDGLDVRCFIEVYNGTTWQRVRTATAASGTVGDGLPGVGLLAFDATAAVWHTINGVTQVGGGGSQQLALLTGLSPEWTVRSNPAAATQATASKAAGAAGVHHVAKSISACFTNSDAAASAIITLNLRDGATGAGTILFSWRFIVPPSDVRGIVLTNLNIYGAAATAMTLETAAATGANVTADVNMSGISSI